MMFFIEKIRYFMYTLINMDVAFHKDKFIKWG